MAGTLRSGSKRGPVSVADLVMRIEAGPQGPKNIVIFDFDGTLIAGYSASAFFQAHLRKLLAAHRGGIKTVMIPEENVKDLQDIPENVKNQLEIVPVRWIERVLEVALESAPTPLPDEEVPVAAAKAEEGAAKTTVVPH